MIGREAQLADLQAFLDRPGPVRVRVITGGGGSGKTRLALELCEQRAAAGWDAGFATSSKMKSLLDAPNRSTWGWQRPTLVVIDYAAQHAEKLGPWLDELADAETRGLPPLRLLLLEREARTESGWWREVFESGGYGAAAKRALLDPPHPWELLPLGKVEDRVAVLAAHGPVTGLPVPPR